MLRASVELIQQVIKFTVHTAPGETKENEKLIAMATKFYRDLATDNTVTGLIVDTNGVCIDELAAVIEKNKTLQDLHLVHCGLDDENILPLLKALKTNNTITKLGLSDNYLSNKTGEAIADIIKHNNSLEILLLSKNIFDNKSVSLILKALETNTSLIHISLDDNSIDSSISDAIVSTLEKNTHLEAISLSGITIEPEDLRKIKAAAKKRGVLIFSNHDDKDTMHSGVQDKTSMDNSKHNSIVSAASSNAETSTAYTSGLTTFPPHKPLEKKSRDRCCVVNNENDNADRNKCVIL